MKNQLINSIEVGKIKFVRTAYARGKKETKFKQGNIIRLISERKILRSTTKVPKNKKIEQKQSLKLSRMLNSDSRGKKMAQERNQRKVAR